MLYITKTDCLANLAKATQAAQESGTSQVVISLYDAYRLWSLDKADAHGYIPVDLSKPLPGTKKKRSDAGVAKKVKVEVAPQIAEVDAVLKKFPELTGKPSPTVADPEPQRFTTGDAPPQPFGATVVSI